MFDLLIKNGQAADPATGFFAEADVAVEGGRIALVEPGSTAAAHETIDAAGLIVQPGVIDTHLHVSTQTMDLRMAAMSGVTTCIDMMGPASAVMNHICEAGAGINVAVLSALVPNVNLPNSDPSAAQIDSAVTTALAEGAFGVKLLGGHFPLSPDATAEAVRTTAGRGVYLAWHAGTTTAGSDIEGMKQAVELADGLPFHLAHINAYCRGRRRDVLEECLEAANLLKAHPEIVTESYLSDRSGAPLGLDEAGLPKSKVVSAQLKHFGFESSADGITAAIASGRLRAIVPNDGILGLLEPKDGVEAFRAGLVKEGVFTGVNPLVSRAFFACARRDDGTFLVDALSTDGGSLPRNVIVEGGCALMKLGGLTPLEFAAKSSLIPARMLGLHDKGSLRVGSDADITIYDPVCGKAVFSFVGGRPVLQNGAVVASGGTVLTTKFGEEAVRSRGLNARVLPGGIPTLDRTFNC